MFKLLRNLFCRTVPLEPCPKPIPKPISEPIPRKFCTRVRHFSDSGKFYIAEYYHKGTWHRFYDPIKNLGFKERYKYQPFLDDFDKCVEFCKTIKTLEDAENTRNKN